MVPVTGLITNGTTSTAGGMNINGTIIGGETITLTEIPSSGLIPVDVPTGGGAPPLTVAATAFQLAAVAAALRVNTATSTAGAATLNTDSGSITTESLTTAAGSTYTFTLTNSLISTANTPPSPVPQIVMYNGTNTGGATQLNSITNGTGSVVAVFQNTGTSAWNGTKVIAFHI
jgi:hypothetical protein